MKKSKLPYLVLSIIMVLFIVSSCTCQNPLSGLSWGTAILRGQVFLEDKLSSGDYTYLGLGDVMISTDVGNDFTYSVTEQTVSKLQKDINGNPLTLEVGEFEMEVNFRVGSTAKSKKITVYANRKDFVSQTSSSNIQIVDGQSTIPVSIKMVTVNK